MNAPKIIATAILVALAVFMGAQFAAAYSPAAGLLAFVVFLAFGLIPNAWGSEDAI